MNRTIIFITSTAILLLEILAGAVMDFSHTRAVVQDLHSIGYPDYVLYIVGVWKVLACIALLWPRLPRLREWAYAGIFFEMSGAAASHLLAGDPLGKAAIPLIFTFLTLVSWWFQPPRQSFPIRRSPN